MLYYDEDDRAPWEVEPNGDNGGGDGGNDFNGGNEYPYNGGDNGGGELPGDQAPNGNDNGGHDPPPAGETTIPTDTGAGPPGATGPAQAGGLGISGTALALLALVFFTLPALTRKD